MSPRIEAGARCVRCGHLKTGLSLYEMLMDPGPCPTPGCGPLRVQATVGRPVPELESGDTGEGPDGAEGA